MAPVPNSMRLAASTLILACRSETVPPREAPATTDPPAGGAPQDERLPERRALFERVLSETGVSDERVRAALLETPRHRFVPDEWRDAAYEDRPLPIGQGQTISQPAVVAVMTAAVAPGPGDRCLEVGTGSGYQAAVLAELCERVYSIEYVPELARSAEKNLRGSGYGPERVVLRTGDGYAGWPEAAPFQVIVVTAAPERVPEPLLDQLAVGGRLVIPVGEEHEVQSLQLIKRVATGQGDAAFERTALMPVRFVPFVGRSQTEN